MTTRCVIEKTKRLMTSRAGLMLLAEVMNRLEFHELVNDLFPEKGNRAYSHASYVQTFVLSLNAGLDRLDDVKLLQKDKALRKVLGVERFPNPKSLGKWLSRMSKKQSAWQAMEKINEYLLAVVLEGQGRKTITLDVDATVVASQHADAEWTYLKHKGYVPMIATVAETGQVLDMELRKGKVPPAKNKHPFIQNRLRKAPAGSKVGEVRIDAAGYQIKIIRLLDDEGIDWTIRAKMSRRLHDRIEKAHGTDCWKRLRGRNGRLCRDREVCRTVHKIGRYNREFTLVIERKPKKEWSQRAMNLGLDDIVELEVGDYIYRAIATTRDDLDDSGIVHHYNQRAEKIESRIRDLKQDFGGDTMPCGDFGASALFCAMTGLAYNTFVLLRSRLPKRYRRRRASTIRKWLYETVAMVVRSGRRLKLKVRQKKRRALLRKAQKLVQAIDPPPLPT